MDKYIAAGKILNTHGVRGQVKIEVWLDSPAFFNSFKTLYLDSNKAIKPLSAFVQKNNVIATLEGIEDINSAIPLKGKTVYIDRADAPKNMIFLQDLIGCKVIDADNKEVGILEEIMERPASDIYVVRGESEHLIPAVPEFITELDPFNGMVRVNLIEGM